MKDEYRVEFENIYKLLFDHFGPQYWWPGDTPLEITVGAILTQNTAWTNVEKAIHNLKKEGLLFSSSSQSPSKGALLKLDQTYLKKLNKVSYLRLSSLIRPAGYFNQKSHRLKNFFKWILKDYGSLNALFKLPLSLLREALLGVNGIGPETADSIILYAANKPTFVIDAYTKRILIRHHLADEKSSYNDLQALFINYLPKKRSLYNEYHALIVQVGKNFCKRKNPKCSECPLTL